MLVAFCNILPAHAKDWDHSKWGIILEKYLNDEGLFNYKGLMKNDEDLALLHQYSRALNKLPFSDFKGWNRNKQMAFLINAYNALTVQLMVDYMNKEGPVESIKDTSGIFSSPWSKEWPFIRLFNGKITTLDGLEHETLRAQYKDYRIHAAVNCASWSCPVLRKQVYKGSTLDKDLDEQMRIWLSDSSKNSYDPKSHTLKLSKIFKWYGEDFEAEGIPAVMNKYGPRAAKGVVSYKDYRVEFMDYNWRLNSP